jgi:hypothetical protein
MRPRPPAQRSGPGKGARGLGLRRVDGDIFELVHPPCVDQRRPDYEEGLDLWRAGDPDEARDALRYALDGCGDNLWIHVALGRLALEHSRDATLARGHFGYAYELARRAIPRDFGGRLPRDRDANRVAYEAIDGLIACYEALGRLRDAAELKALAASWQGPRPRPRDPSSGGS